MKKVYQKPTMKVYEVKMSQIICGSGEGGKKSSPRHHGDEFGYIPGLTDAHMHLAHSAKKFGTKNGRKIWNFQKKFIPLHRGIYVTEIPSRKSRCNNNTK